MSRPRFLITIVLIALACFPFASFTQVKDLNDEVLAYTNKFRRSHGLAALTMVPGLSKLAEEHSTDMAKGRCAFGHAGFEKRQKKIAKDLRFYWVAENVAFGAATAAEVVDLWIHSPGHRENLLGDYKYIGIGTSRSADGEIFYTQIFAR